MTDELSTFNPETFMATEEESGFDTTFPVIPIGEYTAQLDQVEVKKATMKDGVERAVMELRWAVLDESVKSETGLAKPTVRQSIFLDINERGGLDKGKGKNIGLGRLLDGLGMNTGKPWTPKSLEGGMATIKVIHKDNPDDPENPYSNVQKVTSL